MSPKSQKHKNTQTVATGESVPPIITPTQFRSYDLESVLERANSRDCDYYPTVLAAEAASKGKAGDPIGQRVFELLLILSSLLPEHDLSEGGTDDRIGKLKDEELKLIADIADGIPDADLRARALDIIWVRTHDHKAAERAVSAYIESANKLEDPQEWPPFRDRLLRATKLAVKLGRKHPAFQSAVTAVEQPISKHAEREKGLMCEALMSILLGVRAGDSTVYAPIAESFAIRLEEDKNWFFAREYWKLKAEWERRRMDVTAADAATLRAARTYVKEAEQAASNVPASFMRAAHFLTQGVEALRRAAAHRDEITAAHKLLLTYEQKIPGEMQVLKLPDHIVAKVETEKERFSAAARAAVKGVILPEALLRLALFISVPRDEADLQNRLTQRQSTFADLTPVSVVTETGLTSAVNESLIGVPEEAREPIIKNRIYQELERTDWPIAVDFQIAPAVEQLTAEHAVRVIDFAFLVADNPFVPPGREQIYARALYAGLRGDLLVCLHLLIPQIEHSIRLIFQRNGVVTSTLVEGVQEERDLNWLLRHEAMPQFLDSHIAFNLRALLVERFGTNLRNRMAHGLLSESEFYSAAGVYLWWLTLRICALTIVSVE